LKLNDKATVAEVRKLPSHSDKPIYRGRMTKLQTEAEVKKATVSE
jgi:hypothetical protein